MIKFILSFWNHSKTLEWLNEYGAWSGIDIPTYGGLASREVLSIIYCDIPTSAMLEGNLNKEIT